MQTLSDLDPSQQAAQRAAEVIQEYDADIAVMAIARLTAAVITSGVCDRNQMHRIVDELIEYVEN